MALDITTPSSGLGKEGLGASFPMGEEFFKHIKSKSRTEVKFSTTEKMFFLL